MKWEIKDATIKTKKQTTTTQALVYGFVSVHEETRRIGFMFTDDKWPCFNVTLQDSGKFSGYCIFPGFGEMIMAMQYAEELANHFYNSGTIAIKELKSFNQRFIERWGLVNVESRNLVGVISTRTVREGKEK